MADRVVSYDFRGNFTNLTAGLAAAGRGVQDFGGKLSALDRDGAKMRAGLTEIGSTAGRVALGAAAGLAAIVTVTANFDQAMSNVAATGDEARGSLDDLRQAALDAGAATAFSASEAAGGIENLLKAGVSAGDVLGGGLTGALDLAAAGELEVADAAEIAATAMTQFKLSGEDVPRIADLLAAGAGKAQGDVSDLAMALKQSGLVAAQMGVSVEETTGTLAAFASAGLLSSDAGTSFRTTLLRLANPTKESSALMESLGINAYDAQGSFVGMASVAEQLKVAFEGKTDAERDSALATIFGSDAIRAAAILYEQGATGIDGWTAKVDDAGFAAETAATRMDNLRGDLEEFLGSLETALIGSGESAQGPLRSLVQTATGAVNVFNDLPGPLKATATGMLAITTILGGGLWFTSKVITGIANTRGALDDLGITAGRTSGSLGRLARTGAGIATLAASVTILGNALADATGAKIEVSDLQRNLESLADGRNSEFLSRITNDLDKLGSTMGSAVEPVKEIVTGLGLFGNTDLDNSADNIESIDQALAGLVESGNGELAAEIFARIMEGQYGAMRGASFAQDAIDNSLSSFDAYGTALDNTAAASDEAAAANGEYAGAAGEAGSAAGLAAVDVNALAKEMRDQTSAALGAFDANTAYGEAVAAARKQAKTGEQGLNAMTEAGRNNRNALSQLAGAWNEQPAAVKNSQAAYKSARQTFIDVATSMGVSRQKARELANSLLEIPRKTVAEVKVDNSDAVSRVNQTRVLLRGIDGTVATTYIRTVRQDSGPGRNTAGGLTAADGTTVPKTGRSYADRHLYLLADGEEVVSNRYGQADRNRSLLKAINAGRLADGGTSGIGTAIGRGIGTAASMTREYDMAALAAEIRDLKRILAADGKRKLEGHDRRIAELQLKALEKQVEVTKNLRELGRSFSTADLVPDNRDPSVEQGARQKLNELRREIQQAGGEWTKSLRRNAKELLAAASAYDGVQRALDREMAKRERLVDSLAQQQQALDNLTQTMASYSASVAGNFLTNPFNQSYTISSGGGSSSGGGGGFTSPAPYTPDPRLAAELAAAEAELTAIRASTTGDSQAAAESASRLIARIAALRAEAEAAEAAAEAARDNASSYRAAADDFSAATETVVTGLAALRKTLLDDLQAAQRMSAALSTLASKGLDTAGAFGGLYQQLAASGDLATAEELAALSAAQIDEYEKLFKAREDAAAAVAAQATQAVYGQQQAELMKQVAATTAAIAKSDATIAKLNNKLETFGKNVKDVGNDVGKNVNPKLDRINDSVRDVSRQIAEDRKRAKA